MICANSSFAALHDEANRELTKINMFVNRAMSFMMPALMFVMNGVSILIVWAGAHLVEADKLMIGDMLAYLQYAMHVIMSFPLPHNGSLFPLCSGGRA